MDFLKPAVTSPLSALIRVLEVSESLRFAKVVTMESIRDLYVATAGIKPADFDGVVNSFVVDYGMNKGEALSRTYLIRSVPNLIVGGKYSVSAGPNATKIVDYLIDKIRKDRKS